MESSETKLKRAFARELLRTPDDAFKAALTVSGDAGRAMYISREWPLDPEIIAYQEEYVEDHGDKGEVALSVADAKGFDTLSEDQREAAIKCELWRRIRVTDTETAIKGLKLLADMEGLVQKPGVSVTNNTLVDKRSVMVVKDHGTIDEWEAKALRQQATLTNETIN